MNSGSPLHPERQNQSQPVSNVQQSPKLLNQVRNKMRVLHDSIRTESTYVDWIVRFRRVLRIRRCAPLSCFIDRCSNWIRVFWMEYWPHNGNHQLPQSSSIGSSPEPQPSLTADPGIPHSTFHIPHSAVVSRPVNRVVLQIAMSLFALFPRGSTMATAVTHPSPLTVESIPLLVDATAAVALCGKHLRTWRAWWATGPQAGSRGRSESAVS